MFKKWYDYIFKAYYDFGINHTCNCEWMGLKSFVPGHLESHQFLVTLHMQKVGETGWQIHILLTTVESYLSFPFGSTQCLARQWAKCVSACMNIGMISEGGKMWGDSSETYVYVSFPECVKDANVCMEPVFENILKHSSMCAGTHTHLISSPLAKCKPTMYYLWYRLQNSQQDITYWKKLPICYKRLLKAVWISVVTKWKGQLMQTWKLMCLFASLSQTNCAGPSSVQIESLRLWSAEHTASFHPCNIDGKEMSFHCNRELLNVCTFHQPSKSPVAISYCYQCFFFANDVLSMKTITLAGTKWLETTAAMIRLKAAASSSGQPCLLKAP